MNWKKNKLADVCISIADGDHQPPPKTERGIPFVTISNITNTNKFDFTDTMFVPKEYYEGLDDKRRAHAGDILYSVVGSFGIPVFMEEEQKFVFQRHIAILRPDEKKIVPEFLYYTMLSRDFYMKADAVALGAAQRTISLTSLREMEIEIPPYDVQEKIVKILKPYDDLIDRNQKQIKLLEEAAQRLYKEWFLDLRFPGYENCKIVDGIPEGWKKVILDDICVLRKKTLKPGRIEKSIPYIGLEHMPRKDLCLAEWGDSSDINSSKFQCYENDIIFGKIRPYFHKVGYALVNCITSTDAIIMVAEGGFWGLLLMITSSIPFVDYAYKTGKEGAKMPRADWNEMKKYPTLVAAEDIQKEFEENIWIITRRIKSLAMQNRKLAEVRDRLLPKLMSRKIEIQ